MTTSTPNLTLTLYNATTDQSETFADFRAVLAGTASSSNFYKIDTAWGGLDTRIDALEASKGAVYVSATYDSPNHYVATVAEIVSYDSGALIIISPDTNTSGTVELDINSFGNKFLYKINSSGAETALTGIDLRKGQNYLFRYNGSTAWVWINSNSASQINIDGTAGMVAVVSSNNNLEATLTQSALISTTINAATPKTLPIGADKLGLIDSEASNVLKLVTLENIQSFLAVINYKRTWFLT